jgi:hypothetical protein
MSLICFKHPSYSGNSAPVLSCNTCCKIFVDEIKAHHTRNTEDFKPAEWLKQKSKEARQAIADTQPAPIAVNESKYNFRPETI